MRHVTQSSDILLAGNVHVTPAFANISTAASGDTTIVSATASKKIRVLQVLLVAQSDVEVYFVDGANTALCGDSTQGILLTQNSGFSCGFSPLGWFETGAGQTLDLNLDAAVKVAGSLVYITV